MSINSHCIYFNTPIGGGGVRHTVFVLLGLIQKTYPPPPTHLSTVLSIAKTFINPTILALIHNIHR